MKLRNVRFGYIKADSRYSDKDYIAAHRWVRDVAGFYPLFLAVGSGDSVRMTGYQNQWRRVIATKIAGRRKDGTYTQRNVLRKKSGYPNDVLFSFEYMSGIYTDYQFWHIALNAKLNGYDVSDYERRLIFKPSWAESRWLKKAGEDPFSVQLVAPSLDLREAKRIWTRNNSTKRKLDGMGFANVEVKRLPCDRLP